MDCDHCFGTRHSKKRLCFREQDFAVLKTCVEVHGQAIATGGLALQPLQRECPSGMNVDATEPVNR